MHEQVRTNEERVLLVGCHTDEHTEEHFSYSMEELKSLTITAEGIPVSEVVQKRKKIDPATYIGKGKVEEIATIVSEKEIDVVIFNDELTASQVRNLSSFLEVRIIDRTQLILDIFSKRAFSKEGKLQVELAQLNYLLPRLMGKGTALSRLGGGIGTRGPGETKLETDRRHIRKRMDEIRAQLQSVVKHRKRYRDRRKRNNMLQIALVGYTNAGKSTILNRLTRAETLEENQLFATLDPTTRKLKLPNGLTTLLTDTVGFIQDLPTTLIAAFSSTLEEVREADLILHVVDASNENHFEHERTVLDLLEELEVSSVPIVTVYNKRDQISQDFIPTVGDDSILLSAYDQQDLQRLSERIEQVLKQQMMFYRAFIPISEGQLLSRCKSETLLQQQVWHEELDAYEYSGYVHPSLAIANELTNKPMSAIKKEK
ncbi:GTPase HflX [Desertibacillus haloalkaliphilus]|uniref:GTPase HflX n=1 Tax=Desertibacillus haloalkaliphilus TaxID=1328930 RepID=UPI001C2758E2|nr:GTPase HflX [Desertibacillus haloalkaliphilus]MBU8907384.1 GTPase HflX [Desertibacillus haloalkaliphilus]